VLRLLVATLLVALAIGWTGCGRASGVGVGETVPVQGKVQLDGQPLAEGEILFEAPGKPPQILPIANGAYSGQAIPGENRIQIAVYKEEIDSMTNQPAKVNILPPRFSYQSTLKANVTQSGPNEFDFETQSK